MILLDTNAVLWLLTGHPRAAPLVDSVAPLFLSPVSLLELQFLVDCGRLTETTDGALEQVAADPRWTLDDLPSDRLFRAALPVSATRDPFDRLLLAHIRCRQWRLATGDSALKALLPPARVVSL